MAGDDLGQLADRVLQRLGGRGGAALGVHAHEGQHAQADLVAVDFGAVAFDEAGFFQRAHVERAGSAKGYRVLRVAR